MEDTTLEKIANQIKEGFTSGRIDEEDDQGAWHFTHWELSINAWDEVPEEE